MIESRTRRTAERVAIRRAVHQLLDTPRVHDDPIALTILGEDQAAAMRAMGFCGVRDMGPDELNANFLSNRTDGLRVGSAGHILMAVGWPDGKYHQRPRTHRSVSGKRRGSRTF